jgi:hypothetical protein
MPLLKHCLLVHFEKLQWVHLPIAGLVLVTLTSLSESKARGIYSVQVNERGVLVSSKLQACSSYVRYLN